MNPNSFQDLLAGIPGARLIGDGKAVGPCPVPGHRTPRGHLTLSDAGDKALVRCQGRNHSYQELCAALGFGSLRYSDNGSHREPLAVYDYRDGAGRLLYQVLRYEDRQFQQRRPDGNGGWLYHLDGQRRVPYRLADVLRADRDSWVFIPEGEKDADRLASLGLVATTNSGGAGKWPEHFGPYFDGRKVAVIRDNDEPGLRHALDVGHKLLPYATVVKVVELPDLPEKGDVLDWLAQGHSAQELIELVESTSNFTSNLYKAPLEVKLGREANAAELQRQGLESPVELDYHPLLGQEGFLVKGWSHLLGGYPKAGKTELLVNCCFNWGKSGDTILYFTEEPESIWQVRLGRYPPGWEHMNIMFALGMLHTEMLERIKAGQETVVVIDTIRTLLGFKDENDNSEIAQTLVPYIEAARAGGKTIVFVHHNRKGGGEHGEGIAGGHAFLGVVDIALELHHDPQAMQRRLVRGWGRIIPIPELVYERVEDGGFVALGAPGEVALETVKERVLEVFSEDWADTKALHGLLGEPKPSLEQLRKALESLAQDGRAERDPPISEGKRQGKGYRWRLATSLPTEGP